MKKFAVVFLFICFFALPVKAESPSIVISEFQTGSDILTERPANCAENEYDAGKLEFVELYNPTDSSLDLGVLNLKLEFTTESGSTTRTFANLTGQINAKGYFLISYKCFLQDKANMFFNGAVFKDIFPKSSGGYLRLKTASGDIIDQVSWGKATPSVTWWHEPKIIGHDTSINRNFIDGSFSAPTSPTTPGEPFVVGPISEESPQNEDPMPDPPAQNCQYLVLSEILPNPEGTDTDKEFIEIFNPTDKPLNLLGCTLKIGYKQFALPDEQILPEHYRAFYSSQTNLTLPNTSATTVWLISSDREQGVEYPAGLGPNVSWALSEDAWHKTQQPTPDDANIIFTADIKKVLDASRSIPTECGSGKELNPDTNRCKTLQAVPAPVPCKPGQERNPETNRCRSIELASTGPKPCGEGEERNPETNRCRKVLVNTNLSKITEDTSPPNQSPLGYWMIGLLLAAGSGYAIFEWRHNIFRFFEKLKSKGGKL